MNYKLLKKLLRLNFEILCVGDYLNIPKQEFGISYQKKIKFFIK